MGADGHVASLFPRMAVSHRAGPQVIATAPEPLPPEAPFARLSLNLAALVAADAIIVVVTGADKRAVLDAAIRGEADDLPIAQLLRAATCPVTVYWSE
ncbi:MAG: 6-phosphogluconolactonase [Novosphingobium sp.]|nr:6-phosphogluconolactonase [Novosphingobium sp.]